MPVETLQNVTTVVVTGKKKAVLFFMIILTLQSVMMENESGWLNE